MLKEAARNYGSFQDSLKAPVHRWFTYPAGYSYKLVEAKIRESNLSNQSCIADPFVGTGTTSLAAKMLGINSLGVEAHPFVYWVAKTKLTLDHDIPSLMRDIEHVLDSAKATEDILIDGTWPELIYKCFSEENLKKLFLLRKAILELESDPSRIDFLKLALTSTLRTVTSAGAGWPYIAPSRYAERQIQRDAFNEFSKTCMAMVADVQYAQLTDVPVSCHELVNGDARSFDDYCDKDSVDLIVTSPPYLNNYDYADRTRLETYFWGIYNSWGEITREVRDHLIIAATTQIRLSQMNGVSQCPGIKEVNSEVHREIMDIVSRLSGMRMIKAGKKTYDMMVAGYFEDMLKVIKAAHRVLKHGGKFILVLGDSAPYGVHVPTDEIIGRLARAVGFSDFSIEVLRSRGDKWAHNTQRHKVPLRECILTVLK